MLSSIVLDTNFPRRLNHFLNLSLTEISELLAEPVWRIHKPNERAPFWQPLIEKQPAPKGYAWVDPPQYLECHQPKNISDLILQIGPKQLMKNIKKVFECGLFQSDMKAKKLAQIVPFEIQCETNSKCIIDDSEFDSEINYWEIFHPFKIGQYKEQMKSGCNCN